MHKLKLVFALIRSRAYVVVTSTTSAMSIGRLKPDRFNDVLTLSTQLAALASFREKLEELEQEYQTAINNLAKE